VSVGRRVCVVECVFAEAWLGGVRCAGVRCSNNAAVAIDCTVANTSPRDGDEVLMVFHRAGQDVIAKVNGAHPIPLKALVDFQRTSVAAGASLWWWGGGLCGVGTWRLCLAFCCRGSVVRCDVTVASPGKAAPSLASAKGFCIAIVHALVDVSARAACSQAARRLCS
jgi:hypothetical protein